MSRRLVFQGALHFYIRYIDHAVYHGGTFRARDVGGGGEEGSGRSSGDGNGSSAEISGFLLL